MLRHLNIEYKKAKNHPTFWILLVIHTIAIFSIVLIGNQFINTIFNFTRKIADVGIKTIPIYSFPDIWHNLAYVASCMKFILSIYVIISISNEFSFNTLRQNIIDGYSRWDFLKSKISLIVVIGIISTLFLFLLGVILGIVNTEVLNAENFFMYIQFLLGYFLEIVIFMLFTVLVALLIKRAGLVMAVLFVYSVIVEPIISLFLRYYDYDLITNYFPVTSINNIVNNPFSKYFLRETKEFVSIVDVLVAGAYGALFIYLSYLLLKKRDIK